MIRLKTILLENLDVNTININGKTITGHAANSPSDSDKWTYFIGDDGNYYTKLKSSLSGWKNLNILSPKNFAAAKKLIDTYEKVDDLSQQDVSGLAIRELNLDMKASKLATTKTMITIKGWLTVVDASGTRVFPNQKQLEELFGNDTVIACSEYTTQNFEDKTRFAQSKPLTGLNFKVKIPVNKIKTYADSAGDDIDDTRMNIYLSKINEYNIETKADIYAETFTLDGKLRYAYKLIAFSDIKK